MSEKVDQSLLNVEKALSKLQIALNRKIADELNDEILIDGTIQRFEFCIELFWKLLKRVLSEEGITTGTPREAIQQAYQAHWIENEQIWVQMLRDRNQTSHTYDEALADEIYARIPSYYLAMLQVLEKLKEKRS